VDALLILDNYDSFTYNLVHLVRKLGHTNLEVHRNDKIAPKEVDRFGAIILSPGPGIPLEAGNMPEIVRTYAPRKRILGVCLGHQCIGEIFGGTLVNMPQPVHGKGTPTVVTDREDYLFRGLPERFTTGRYHSWLVGRPDFPRELAVSAEDDAGNIMALRHRKYDVRGVQFHPESVLTEHGEELMRNWLQG
jgi:anthranilate synthase component 2